MSSTFPPALRLRTAGRSSYKVPDLLFLKDADGDGKAEIKKTLFSGWGTSDTHAGPSNLKYGLDNWIYGIVGYSAFEGTVGGEHHRFGQGMYRFKPDGSKLEFLRSTNNNSWGVGFSEEGLLFGSTANGCPSVFLPIPNRYYEAVRGWSAHVLQSIADSNRFQPITEKVPSRSIGTAASPRRLGTLSTEPGLIPRDAGTRRRSSPSPRAT